MLTLNILSRRGRTIRPKTLNQKRYVDAIDKHTIVFGIGPAGTGKTYLAMAKAVQALQAKQVNRIILTRPAVEAGERLGFLPGTLYEKIDPYLRPLYDALHDMIDPDSIPRLMTGRHDRGRPAGVHARPHPQRRVHHPRRGAEHHARADEDVPDPARASARRSWSPATSPRSTCPAARRSGLRVVREILDGVEDVHFAHAGQRRRRAPPAGQRHRRRLRAVGRRAGSRTTVHAVPDRRRRGGRCRPPALTPRRITRVHRDRQRVRRRRRLRRHPGRRPARPRRDGGQPARRAVDPAGRRRTT